MLKPQSIPLNSAFPHGHCTTCGQEALLYRDLDDQGDWLHRCLDCDATVEPSAAAWAPEEVLEAGYAMEGVLGEPEPGGCSGKCSSGSCSH